MSHSAQASPTPGGIFREYVWLGPYVNAGNWQRVTDPDARHAGAGEFLPNPVNTISIGDLMGAIRAEVVLEQWGGHAGTSDKRLRLNGNDWIAIAEPGIPGDAGTHPQPECYQYLTQATVPLPLDQLHQGDNTFEFTSGGQICFDFGWGQWGVYGVTFRIYYDESAPHITGQIVSPASGQQFGEALTVEVEAGGATSVDVIALYDDFDYEGNGRYRQWHYTYRYGEMQHHLGTSREAPFTVTWQTDWVPDQPRALSLMARVGTADGVYTWTEPVEGLVLERPDHSVKLYRPFDVPPRWQTRAGGRQDCKVFVPHDLARATEARLILATWSGGHADAIGIGITPVVERVGGQHAYSYDEVNVPPALLRAGTMELYTEAATEHHGIEVLWPGIALKVRYDAAAEALEPDGDADVYREGLGRGWKVMPGDVDVDIASTDAAQSGAVSMHLQIDNKAWQIDLRADPVVPLAGYESLRLAFLPADVTVERGSWFFAYINDRRVSLLAEPGDSIGVDLGRPEWQVLRIPLRDLDLRPYLGSLRFAGRFSGSFYLDDVALVPALNTAVSASPTSSTPLASRLLPNYPNPFNGGTTVPFEVLGEEPVDLTVYSMMGQPVAVLAGGRLGPGRHLARWDGRDEYGRAAASGVYLCRLKAGDRLESRRLVLVR